MDQRCCSRSSALPQAWCPPKLKCCPTASLVVAYSCAPLSLDAVGETVKRKGDGTSETESVKTRIYRDASGRVRAEPDVNSTSSGRMIRIYDPVVGLNIALMPMGRIAYRTAFPAAKEKPCFRPPFASVAEMHRGSEPKGRKSEILGDRLIEGIKFEGSRLTIALEDRSLQIVERWFSLDLGVTALAITSGPIGTTKGWIENVTRAEPDPSLFLIPPDYTVQDIPVPQPPQ